MSDKVRTRRGQALAERARWQHGVISARQLRELGYSTSTVSDAVKRGRLHSIHRGVYAVGHTSLSWEGYCLAAVLARPGAVASHKTAAWIWELRRWRPETIHLTAPTRQRVKRDFVVHFAPDESTRDLHRMMERAEERKTFDLRRFDRLLARVGGHPGRVKLRYALDTFKPEQAMLRSNLERRFRGLAGAPSRPRSVGVRVPKEALGLPAPGGSPASASGADIGGDPGRTSRCCEGRVTPDVRHAARETLAHLERRRRAGGPRRSVA